MFDYVADMFRAETAETEEEADAWYEDHINNRRTPDLLPRDEVARAINSEVKAGRGTPARRRLPRHRHRGARPSTSSAGCPSMYHQFMELAGVDITAEPMEVGPTCHYMMGGVRVDAETAGRPPCRASSPPARWRAACTARTASAATRSSDLIVFGRRAGIGAADFAEGRTGSPQRRRGGDRLGDRRGLRPVRARGRRQPLRRPRRSCRRRCRRWSASSAPGPSSKRRWPSSRTSSEQTAKVQVKGGRAYNPGWNLATDLPVDDHDVDRRGPGCARTARSHAAATPGRTTRARTPRWARSTSCSARRASRGTWRRSPSAPEPLPEMPAELRELFEEGK